MKIHENDHNYSQFLKKKSSKAIKNYILTTENEKSKLNRNVKKTRKKEKLSYI